MSRKIKSTINIVIRIADIILRFRLILALQSRHVIVSITRIGRVGSRPVLWKWHSLRSQLLKHKLMHPGCKVHTPPVATLSHSAYSQVGRRKSIARLGRTDDLGAALIIAGNTV